MRKNRYDRALRIFSALVGIAVGLASFVLLVTQGGPTGDPRHPGKRVKLTHTNRSGCPERCSKPQRVETEVTLSSTPATSADDPSVIERALDNDGGVLVIRLIAALLAALATATTLDRLLRRPDERPPPPDEGVQIVRSPEDKPRDPTDTKKQGEERDAPPEPKEVTKVRGEDLGGAARQALLQEWASRLPRVRIVRGPASRSN